MFSTYYSKVNFLLEAAKLKNVIRRNYIADGSRRENAAEHSWQAALAALLFLPDNSTKDLNLLKVLKMLLIHDLVEIEVGDTFPYTDLDPIEIHMEEREAAERIFAKLPNPVSSEFLELWLDFESGKSKEARYAKSIDHLVPVLNTYGGEGKGWKENHLTYEVVYTQKCRVKELFPSVWATLRELLSEARSRNYFHQD